mmetsp:Transcript_11482/g.27074  ORF Transcript_11482/g.27074 Transcript_11482/m.27074 type:complete len:200 (+) Transcript_11482:874-1473(+)
MVVCDRAERISIAIEALAEVAVAVQIVQLLVKGLVRERLVTGEAKIFAAISHPVQFQSQTTAQLDEDGKAAEEGSRTARLEDEHVGIDEEGALGQDVGIEVLVADVGEDGAPRPGADSIQIRSVQAAEADALDVVLPGSGRRVGIGQLGQLRFLLVGVGDAAEDDLQSLLGSLEDAGVLTDLTGMVVVERSALILDHRL